MSARPIPLVVSIALATTLVFAACGGDGSGPQLSELAEEGKSIAADAGCAGCHGSRGRGGVGPAWVALAGSLVELEDGSVVTADSSYLRSAIVDPSADLVAGYTIRMPQVDLTEAEIEALVAYIEELR